MASGTRFLMPRRKPKDTEYVSPTLCSVQFWLLVSSGRHRNCLTFVRALALRIVWLIQAEPISTWANDLLVSARRSVFGKRRMALATVVLSVCRRANSLALARFRWRNG